MSLVESESFSLTEGERARFAVLHKIVQDRAIAFYEMGLALMEIKDSSLWKETHCTFEDYVAQTLSHRPRTVQCMIKNARILKRIRDDLGPEVTLPTSANLVRSLYVNSTNPTKVWAESLRLSSGAAPTQAIIHQAAQNVAAKDTPAPRVPKTNTVKAETLPPQAQPDPPEDRNWDEAAPIPKAEGRGKPQLPTPDPNEPKGKQALTNAYIVRAAYDDLKGWFKDISQIDTTRVGCELLGRKLKSIKVQVENALAILKTAIPTNVCSVCAGNGCPACNDVGWIHR